MHGSQEDHDKATALAALKMNLSHTGLRLADVVVACDAMGEHREQWSSADMSCVSPAAIRINRPRCWYII